MTIPPGTINPALRNEEVLRFLLTRRSRPPKMLTAPVPDRDGITEILTAAARVPDHGKLEPWRFVVSEKPALERLADAAAVFAANHGLPEDVAAKGVGQFAQSPLCIALIAVPKQSEKVPEIGRVRVMSAV